MGEKPSPNRIVEISVPANHPSLAGHFPGRPIVPGALLLCLIQQEMESALTQPLHSLARLRFHLPVLPEQTLQLQWRAQGEGQWRFVVSSNGQTAIKGIARGNR